MKSFKEMRQDPHCPRLLDPADYVYVGYSDRHPGATHYYVDRRRLADFDVSRVEFYDATEDGRPNYRCHHCGKHGSNIYYFCFFLHKPTKKVVVVGQICAEKLNLDSKEQLDVKKHSQRDRAHAEQQTWSEAHPDEAAFLSGYEHGENGFTSPFLASLAEQLRDRGSLSEKQLTALRTNMEKRKEIDGDRHKGHVVRTDDEPTEAQWSLIHSLCEKLNHQVPSVLTRLDASNFINQLKAELQSRSRTFMATERQINYIKALLSTRQIDPNDRLRAEGMIDDGLTRDQASRWIDKLLTLPEVPS